MKTILETIDTRYGTDNSHSFSHGNTLPYTGEPFGMNYLVLSTRLAHFSRHSSDPPAQSLDWGFLLALAHACHRKDQQA